MMDAEPGEPQKPGKTQSRCCHPGEDGETLSTCGNRQQEGVRPAVRLPQSTHGGGQLVGSMGREEW